MSTSFASLSAQLTPLAEIPQGCSADVAEAQAWLDDLTSGTATEHAGVGIGTVVEVSGSRSVGSALVTDDTVVHLAAFPAGHVREGVLV